MRVFGFLRESRRVRCRSPKMEEWPNGFVAAIGCAAFLASSSAEAVFIDFETDPGGLTPTTNPTQGGPLDNARTQ